MRSTRLAGFLVLGMLAAAPAAADVTIRQKTSGKSPVGGMSGETVQYLKGTRMRTDQTVGGAATSVIVDAAAQRMISLDHKRRQAEVHDMRAIAGEIAKVASEGLEARVTPTAKAREIAGHACTVHDMSVRVPMQMGGDTLMVVMSGPVCLAKGVPGEADYAAFYRAAAEKGLFFGDPRTAKAQPGQARGMSELYREMASRGVPLSLEMQIGFEGSGPMAAMMSKMSGSTIVTEVTSIEAGALADSLFEVPEGYTVAKR